jgi:thiol-disulfide isomerase/thioredoxin
LSRRSKMTFILNLAIVFCLSLLLITAFACKNKSELASNINNSQETAVSTEAKNVKPNPNNPLLKTTTSTSDSKISNITTNKQQNKLPKLIDLGAGKCIPCKMMAPILDELKTDYAGKLAVEVIDVWENPKESEKYGINLIPTQIFYDPEGKEFSRHEGFMSKEDILATFKQKGMKLE